MELTEKKINQWARQGIPFLFVFDFEMKHPLAMPLSEISSNEILFSINGTGNAPLVTPVSKSLYFDVFPVSKDRYSKAFDLVQRHIVCGNSFLLNLTLPSCIKTNYSLKEIFYRSRAKYKLWIKDRFVVFSPEIFVKTAGRSIYSYPMKGTIDAQLPQARHQLLNNRKELSEHYTIVDLIRNDLSISAKKVRVTRFRYTDNISTNKKELLQISSEITGELPPDYKNHIGSILIKMLPAGSISGAPKKKTLEIIKAAEQYERGYYTGIFGVFDGKNIDSGVMIRFIENTVSGFAYKSGGGITAQSRCEEEYNELIDKIYVPFA